MIDIALEADERIDDLQLSGLYIIQRPSLFCFGMDSVLLSDFVSADKKERVCDLCSGNGVIPLLLYGKGKGADIMGIELQKDCFDLAERSLLLNEIKDKIKFLNSDIRQPYAFKKGEFDVVTCNPPYMKVGSGKTGNITHKAIARHEITCKLEDVFFAASYLLKYGGRFYMVHRPNRLADIFRCADKYETEPKRIQFVCTDVNKAPSLCLMEFVKKGKPNLVTEPNIIVYNDKGDYTEQFKKIYYGGTEK